MAEFPQVVALAAQELAPHHVSVLGCAIAPPTSTPGTTPNGCWSTNQPLKLAFRLRLAATTRQVLANGLALLGVSAPDRM
nr:DALR anticodon-binding domain-containing protein [Bordetella pertussis]